MTTNPNAIDSQTFIVQLDEEIGAMLARLGQMSAAGVAPETLTVEKLLRLALKNELEATELAAIWLATTAELDVKLALARQCGDEAKHYRMIAERLETMGVDAAGIDPRAGGDSPLFEFLRQKMVVEKTIDVVTPGSD